MNCSQKLISLIFGTTAFFAWLPRCMLWIALKSWYLWYSEQQKFIKWLAKICCELLSKVDIFDIRNNSKSVKYETVLVVNCSQKLISLIFGTTWKIRRSNWISCELLSKVDIFDIRNNDYSTHDAWNNVVNCSQKLISLIFGTTINEANKTSYGCELLSKVDIFDIRNNLNGLEAPPVGVVNCSQKLISLIFGTTLIVSGLLNE